MQSKPLFIQLQVVVVAQFDAFAYIPPGFMMHGKLCGY